jgi:drug/metabolite transporter (DMT)-like permease
LKSIDADRRRVHFSRPAFTILHMPPKSGGSRRADGPLTAQLALWLATLIWGSTFVLVRLVLPHIGPAALTTIRFALALAVLLPVALVRGARPRMFLRPALGVAGLFGVALAFGLQAWGLEYTSAGSGALIQAAQPITAAIIGMIVLSERLSPRGWFGMAIAVLGVVLVTGVPTTHGRSELAGDLLVLTGVACYSGFLVMVRSLGPELDPILTTVGAQLWGLVLLLPWMGAELAARGTPHLSAADWAVVAYLGVMSSGVTLLLSSFALRTVDAWIAALYSAGIPAAGYLFALASGEPLLLLKVLGGAVAVAGVLIGSWRRAGSVPPADARSAGVPATEGSPPRVTGHRAHDP